MRKAVVAGVFILGFGLSWSVVAQSYPVRPVTLVVPFGPGASSETETRLYANNLTPALGQSFVLDFKPGAGGSIGAAHVARAKPDGYTLLGTSGSFTSAPALKADLPFDPVKDFAPISLMSARTTVVAAHPKAPFSNIAEYVAYTKANPSKVNAGTPGIGSTPHLNTAWFHSLTNTSVTFVHYKATALTLADLMAGRIDVFFGTALAAYPHLKSGKLKLLGIANAERSPLLPDARTVAEQGVKGFNYASLFGIVAPAGVPPGIIDKLSAELAKIAKLPEVIKRIEAAGGIMIGSTPEEFRSVIVSDIARYKKVARELGIAPK